jgi:uncharacterized protein
MRVIRFKDLRPSVWKNGGGSTVELAVRPEGANLDAFEWRVSVADVSGDGEFSRFQGVDRVLTLLSGAGMELEFTDRSVRLEPSHDPFAFSGEAPVAARLGDGPVRDVNVMVKRGDWRAAVTRERLAPGADVRGEGDARVLVALDDCALHCAGMRIAMASLDAVVLEPYVRVMVGERSEPARIVFVALHRTAPE